MIRGNKKHTKITKQTKGFTRGKKTKKMSFKRAKNTPKIGNGFLGGFLPFPPKDCPKKEHFTLCYGIVWIDLSICHWCNNIKECSTRKEHLQKLKDARKEYFSNLERSDNGTDATKAHKE